MWSKDTIKLEANARWLGELLTVGVFRGKNVMGNTLMTCSEALQRKIAINERRLATLESYDEKPRQVILMFINNNIYID